MWISKKKFQSMEDELISLLEVREKLVTINEELADKVEDMLAKYPFELGQVVYDLQLRNDKGRYTKKNPSRTHSVVNEVTVDKKNYFTLVDRFIAKDVFKTLKEAEKHLDEVCVD